MVTAEENLRRSLSDLPWVPIGLGFLDSVITLVFDLALSRLLT
jgi:hypothetical protein